MDPAPGTPQRRLHRVRCGWGREEHGHQVAYPVFDSGYKVLGILAYTLGEPPLWYAAVPNHVQGRELRFKSPYQEWGPVPVNELPDSPFAGTYLCDPWHVIRAALEYFRPMPDWPMPTDLFERTIDGQPIIDCVFEPPLHRVRGFVLRRGSLWRTRRVSILMIPALEHALDPPGSRRPKRRGPAGLMERARERTRERREARRAERRPGQPIT